jgi:tetratricopeptide (TPR) repeat protein
MSAAKASYARAIALNPLHFGSYFELGKAHLALLEDSAAERYLKTSASLAPNFRPLELNHYLAELLFHRNRDAEAEGYYRSALALAEQNDARLHVNLALALSNQGRAEEASATCMAFSRKGGGIEGSTEIQWTAPHRFEHDIEQMWYLQSVKDQKQSESGLNGVDLHDAIKQYTEVQAEVGARMKEEEAATGSWWGDGGYEGGLVELTPEQLQRLNATYNQVWHMPKIEEHHYNTADKEIKGEGEEKGEGNGGGGEKGEGNGEGGEKGEGNGEVESEGNSVVGEPLTMRPMLNPNLAVDLIEEEYASSNITVIDDLLSVRAAV